MHFRTCVEDLCCFSYFIVCFFLLLSFHPLGVLYNQFLSQVDFELLRNYANDLGVLVFENPARRVMVVTQAGHPDVKRFWKRQKHS